MNNEGKLINLETTMDFVIVNIGIISREVILVVLRLLEKSAGSLFIKAPFNYLNFKGGENFLPKYGLEAEFGLSTPKRR